MIITQSQMAGMGAAARTTFARRLARHLDARRKAPIAHDGNPVPTGEALEARVCELIDVAATFGVRTELALGQFVVLGIAYARDFHKLRRVQDLLGDPTRTPEQNVQAVLNAVIAAERRGGGRP